MRRPTTGKKVAFVFGIIALVCLGLAGFSWKAWLARYHVFLLQRDPHYLLQIVIYPEATPQKDAVRLFVKTESGGRTLLSAILEVFERAHKGTSLPFKDAARGVVGFEDYRRLAPREPTGVWCKLWQSNVFEHWEGEDNSKELPAMVPLLSELEGRELTLPEYPALRLSIVMADEALSSFRVWVKATTDIPEDLTEQFASFPETTFSKHPLVLSATKASEGGQGVESHRP